jgi:hypothetical protein
MPEQPELNQPATGKSRSGVLCAKCDHLNPPGASQCTACGSHLHVTCTGCGQRNPRVLARCPKCGRRLHRSRWRRLKRKFFNKRWKVTPLQIILLVVLVLVAYKLIILLVEYKPTAPE